MKAIKFSNIQSVQNISLTSVVDNIVDLAWRVIGNDDGEDIVIEYEKVRNPDSKLHNRKSKKILEYSKNKW